MAAGKEETTSYTHLPALCGLMEGCQDAVIKTQKQILVHPGSETVQ